MKTQGVIYRQANLDDIEKLEVLEINVWGEKMAARCDKWVARINIFPEGTNVAEVGKNITGVIVSHIIDWRGDNGDFPTWEEATGNGYITNHTDLGNTMYGVNVSVMSGMPKVAESLIKLNLEIARKRNIKTIFGCRIPTFFQKFNTEIGSRTEDLLAKCALRDPEIKFFIMKFGFKIIGFKQNYFSKDSDSLGWGVILMLN